MSEFDNIMSVTSDETVATVSTRVTSPKREERENAKAMRAGKTSNAKHGRSAYRMSDNDAILADIEEWGM